MESIKEGMDFEQGRNGVRIPVIEHYLSETRGGYKGVHDFFKDLVWLNTGVEPDESATLVIPAQGDKAMLIITKEWTGDSQVVQDSQGRGSTRIYGTDAYRVLAMADDDQAGEPEEIFWVSDQSQSQSGQVGLHRLVPDGFSCRIMQKPLVLQRNLFASDERTQPSEPQLDQSIIDIAEYLRYPHEQ